MAESYKLYKTHEFIRKDEKGDLDFDRSLAMIRELVKAASYHREHNILVDIRETEAKLNFVELLNVALEFAKYEDLFSNKIAFLIPNVEERIKRSEYVKKCLVGVMGFQLEYFTKYEKAIDWLSTIKETDEGLCNRALPIKGNTIILFVEREFPTPESGIKYKELWPCRKSYRLAFSLSNADTDLLLVTAICKEGSAGQATVSYGLENLPVNSEDNAIKL